ncbi:MAG: M20/M25/M40 family metallo-hydrolase [Planctomycetaceae bacterium]
MKCRSAVLIICLTSVPAWAADRAASLITTGELRTHVETLAADSLEGREAGRRGGHAAAAYLLSELKRLDVRPAGEAGSFVQEFGPGYRNILVLIPGSDEALKEQVVVVGAHYDHVGYGAKGNSFGPLGQIHNGADDNASGTAALLELVESFAALKSKPKRTLLFAFWDAEEKGLLGSEHWLSHPTVTSASVVFTFNFDMLGRMRNRKVEVYGVRTAIGLRRLVSEQNFETDLTLQFDWNQREDSDHWSFFQRGIPYLMLHSGLHDEYHRPSDDANLINFDGLHAVTTLSRATIVAVANAPSWSFRPESREETGATAKRLAAPLTRPPARFGVRWDATQGERGVFVLTDVVPNSPAAVAGLHAGDRIARFEDRLPADTAALRKAVLAAEQEATVTIERNDRQVDVPVRLAGSPVRVGLSWRIDAAEPGVLIVRRIVAGSAAGEAGLNVGDRLYEVDGKPFTDEAAFRDAFRDAGESPELSIERNGRSWKAALQLPQRRRPVPETAE